MSDGFAGSSTRSLDSLEREIEYRLGHMSEDEFREGVNQDRHDRPFSDKHTDLPARSKPGFVRGEATASNPAMNFIDRVVQKTEGGIKPEGDQFPMKKEMSTQEKIEMRLAALEEKIAKGKIA